MPKLEYLFTARFRDGSVIHQTPQDVSRLEPLTRSAFYDVLQRLPEVESFTLYNGRTGHTVFLTDGHFNSDGRILVNPHGELTNFRLIYFRTVSQNMEGDTLKPARVTKYVIGWQANDAKGQNFQMKIEILPDNG